MLTNVHHAFKNRTSYNGRETRAHTEFTHNQARSALSHCASSADHVLLLTINLTLCGHTLYEYMFVLEDPRLTQAGPACMIFCMSNQNEMCFVEQDHFVRP